MSYCESSKKGTVTVVGDGNTTTQVLSTHPPITVTVNSGGRYADYSHSMTNAINQTFDSPISGVVLTPEGQTYNNGAATNPIRDCPIPSIIDNRIVSDFDNYYGDNSGTCTYRVYFGGWRITISDSSGQIFEKSYNQKPEYTVACDDDCPNGYCKIDCEQYPGYCCISEAEIQGLINQLNS